MAISDEERRIFEELQRDIERDDPSFARRLSGESMTVRSVLLNVVIFLAGVVLLLFGVGLQNTLVGIVGFSAMIYAGIRASTGKGIIRMINEDGTDIDPGMKV